MDPTRRDAADVRRPGYPAVVGLLLLVMLAAFGLVEALEVPLLTDPSSVLDTAGLGAAAAGLGLLLADVALPVPASLVMVANGALFGVVVGAALSLVGGLGATLLAFTVGRRGRGALDRIATPAQRRRADDLLARYGLLAVVVTRPVPMLAETVALLAGTSRLAWGRVALAGVAGTLPGAVLYAVAGAAASSALSSTLVFVAVLAIALLFWAGGRLLARRRTGPASVTDG